MTRQDKNLFVATLFILLITIQSLVAQNEKTLTLPEVFRLAIANSKQLKLSHTAIEVAEAATQRAETALLPSLDVSLSASYLGNVTISNRNFSDAQEYQMPHLGNNLALDASLVIFAGGGISNSIQKARLQEQIAKLNLERNELDICFLVTGYYLDLYKMYNQRKVFAKNIEQTELLIQQIKSREIQGMALSNDITRHELMLQNIKLALVEVYNTSEIINQQLTTTLGLPSGTRIIPDSTVLDIDFRSVDKGKLFQQACDNLPELKTAEVNKVIASKETKIAKADYYPHAALIAANHLDGPITIEVPTINRNLNYWYVGIALKYNLASLYKTKKNVKLAVRNQQMAENDEAIALEHTQVAVQAAYIRFQESFEKLKVYETSSRLAADNYRVINNRYLNETVLITEMLDASNTKLNAELELVNARLNVIYSFYRLQREIGSKVH